jgi:hypothetical protein
VEIGGDIVIVDANYIVPLREVGEMNSTVYATYDHIIPD